MCNPTRAFPTVTLRAETRRKGGVRGGVDENRRAINQRNLAMPPSRARRCGSHGENVDRRHQIWMRSQTHSLHSAVAPPADWLLGACGHPRCQLLSPSSNFSHAGADGILKTRSPPLFASCRWHHNSKANARHVSAFLCVPLSILTSPHQVVPKYISLDTGISRRLNMPAATSPTSLLVPLFCPTFFLPELQRTAQCQSVLPTYPSHKPPSHMVLLPFQTLLQDTVLYPTPPAEPNRRDPSSLCAGVLVYLAWAADLFENHRIFSHLSRDLHHTSGVKTAPILKTGN